VVASLERAPERTGRMMRRQADFAVPCSAMAADGVYRGAMLGAIWGSVTDLELLESLISDTPKQSHRIIRRANAIARSTVGFAVFIGAYSGGCCLGERVTGYPKDHYIPTFVGGFFGGSLLSVRSRNAALCAGIGATTGAFAGLVRYLQMR